MIFVIALVKTPQKDRKFQQKECQNMFQISGFGPLSRAIIFGSVLPSNPQHWNIDTTLSALVVAVAALAVMIGLVAILGWPAIDKIIKHRVKSATDEASMDLEGRMHGVQGVLFGQMARDKDDNITRPDLLEQAIHWTEKAKDQIPAKNRHFHRRALNNLAFYYALKGDAAFARTALKMVEELHDDSPQTSELDTFARVVAVFGEHAKNPAKMIQQADDAINSILNDEHGTSSRGRDAALRTQKCIGALKAKLKM